MPSPMRVEAKEGGVEQISIVGNWKNSNVHSCRAIIQTFLCVKRWLLDST